VPNLKFVSLAILELLPFNAQKFTGSRYPGHSAFENFSGAMSRLSMRACVPNLKSVALALTKLLAFNSQILSESRDSESVETLHLNSLLLPSFDIPGLVATKGRCLNYEPL